MTEQLAKQLIEWRRDFHQYPETGFLEMRTASIVAGILNDLGFDLQMGREVMAAEHCMGKPDEKETENHYQWALENGANPEYIERFKDGYTGIVATLDTQKDGPVLGFRFDMDALDINEASDERHVPAKEGYKSRLPYKMHACGHDAHTTIGLGFATLLMAQKDRLTGKIKLIFQPAEEGTRGARSMAEAGVVDDVDYFIASHIGTGVPDGEFVASNNGFLATSKLNVSFKGVSSHAGGHPEEGRNALLAAASAALNIHAIARHSGGATRMNVGELHAGTGRNIIADEAQMKVETRGETSEINEYVKAQAKAIIAGAAQMYQLSYTVDTVGEALSCRGSEALAKLLHETASDSAGFTHSELSSDDAAGSEDATYFMERVQRHGGEAVYAIFGTALAAGHHNERFDINEATLLPAAELLLAATERLLEK